MSKKVGIITFHEALNYGAVLQAYALKAVCEELGYEAHIVNYNYGGMGERVAPVRKFLASSNKKAALSSLARGVLGYFGDKKREKAFALFREKYLNESLRCDSSEDISALGYDVLIAGSDQIWNPNLGRKDLFNYFFNTLILKVLRPIISISST